MLTPAGAQVKTRRRLLLLFIVFVGLVVALVARLFWIQVVQADELHQKAWDQWNRSIPAQSPRGGIYDRNERLLAGSSTVETVVALPSQIEDPDLTARQLEPVLEVEASRLKELMTRERAAVYLKRKVDNEVAQEVRDLELPGIEFTTEGDRFYPHGNLASQLIGFVGMDQGWTGLELMYEEELQGKEGRLFFPSDARNRPIPHEVSRFVPPEDGKELILTIDETIQYIVERELSRALEEFAAKQAQAVAVEPKTGEVLAVASKPDFDPENYAEYDSNRWNLPPVTSTFEPGSTMKLATLMAAIEEGIYNAEEDLYCPGHKEVAGTEIGCWTSDRGGHGSIDFREAVHGSCNVGFMQMGEELGKEKLFSYLERFGFGSRMGIDYPGEGQGLVFHPDAVGPLELATTSFGQGISVTPLQQAMVFSAVANGGYLMEPYVVDKVRDGNEEVIKDNEPKAIRQIVSNDTALEVTDLMEGVVEEGSGRNAYIEGYRVAGKTGTAQKVGPEGRYMDGEFILSFVGFAPVEQPQVLLYVAVDGATRGSQWGSQVGAPVFHRIMKDVLNYLGLEPREDTILPEGGVLEVPDLVGLDLNEAGLLLEDKGLKVSPIGDGEKIVNQTPKGGAQVPLQSRIIVYLGGNELPSGEVVVPDLTGASQEEAKEVLSWLGLELESEGNGVAVEQYPESGTTVTPEDEIEVIFRLQESD